MTFTAAKSYTLEAPAPFFATPHCDGTQESSARNAMPEAYLGLTTVMPVGKPVMSCVRLVPYRPQLGWVNL